MDKIMERIKLALNKTTNENISDNTAQQTKTCINKQTKNTLNETYVDKKYVDVLYKKRDYAESEKNGSMTDETPSLEGSMIGSKRNGGEKTTGISDIKYGHVKFSLKQNCEESVHENKLKKCKPYDVLSKMNSNTASVLKSNGDRNSILRSNNSSRVTYNTGSVTCRTNASDRSESEEMESKLAEDIRKLTICKVYVEKRLNAFMENRKQVTMCKVESGEHTTVVSCTEKGESGKHEESEIVTFEKGDFYVNKRNLVVDVKNEFNEETGENKREEVRHVISVRSDRVYQEPTIPGDIQKKISTNRCGINSVLQVDSKFGPEVASSSDLVPSISIMTRDPVIYSAPLSSQGRLSSNSLGRELSRKTNYSEKNKRKAGVTGSNGKKISWLNCEKMTHCSLTKFCAVYNPEEKKDVQLGWMNAGYLMRHDSREMTEELRGNGIGKRRAVKGSRTGSLKKRSVQGDDNYLIIEVSPEKRERNKREEIRRTKTDGSSCVSGGRNIETEMVGVEETSASRRKVANSIRMKVNKNGVADEGCRKRRENSPKVHDLSDNRGNKGRGEVLNLETNKELQRRVGLNEGKCATLKDQPTMKKKCESALKLNRNPEFRRVNPPVTVNIVTVKHYETAKRTNLETGSKLRRHSDFKGLENKRIFKTPSLKEHVKMKNGYLSRDSSVVRTNKHNQVNRISDHDSIQCASDTANKNERNMYAIVETLPRGFKDCQHSRSNGSVAIIERNPTRQQRGRSLNGSSKRVLMNIVTPRAVTNYATATHEDKTLKKNGTTCHSESINKGRLGYGKCVPTEFVDINGSIDRLMDVSEDKTLQTSKSKVYEESVTAGILKKRVSRALSGCTKKTNNESENVNERVDLQLDRSGNMLQIDTNKGFKGVVHNSYVEIMNGIWKENLELKNISVVEPMQYKSLQIDECVSKNVTEVVHKKNETDTNAELEKNAAEAKKQLKSILTLSNGTDEPLSGNIGGHDKNDIEETKCSNLYLGQKFLEKQSQSISDDVPSDQQHFKCNAFGKTIEINIERRGIFLLDRCLQNFVQTKTNSVPTELKDTSISTGKNIEDLVDFQTSGDLQSSGCAEENGMQAELTLDVKVLKTEESLKLDNQTAYLRLLSHSAQKLLNELNPSVHSDKTSGDSITPPSSLPLANASNSENVPHVLKIKRNANKKKKHENAKTKSHPASGKEKISKRNATCELAKDAEEQKSAKLVKRPVHVCNKPRFHSVKRKDNANLTVTPNSEAIDDTLLIKKKRKINFKKKYRLLSNKKSNEGKPLVRKPSWKHVNLGYSPEEEKCETRGNLGEEIRANRPTEELLADIPRGVFHNEDNTRKNANNAMLVRKHNMTWNNLDQRLLFSNLDQICKEIDERLVLYLTQLGEMLPRVAFKDLFDKDFNLRSIKELDVTTFTTKTEGIKYPFHTENKAHDIRFPHNKDEINFWDYQLKVQGENPENLQSKFKQYLLCKRKHDNECELNEDLKNKFATAETFGNLKAPNEKYIDNGRETVDVLCGKEKQTEPCNTFLDEWANKDAKEITDERSAHKKQSLDILFRHGGVQLDNNELPWIDSNNWEDTFARSNDAWKFDTDKKDTPLGMTNDRNVNQYLLNVQRGVDLFGNHNEDASYRHFTFCNAREFERDNGNGTRLILNQYKPNVNFSIQDGGTPHIAAASEKTAHEDKQEISKVILNLNHNNNAQANTHKTSGTTANENVSNKSPQPSMTIDTNGRETNADKITGLLGCDGIEKNLRLQESYALTTAGTSDCQLIDNASQLKPNESSGCKRQEFKAEERFENKVALQNMLTKPVKALGLESSNAKERSVIVPTEVGTSKTHAERVTVKPRKHKREKFHFVKKGEKKETQNNMEQEVFDIEDKSAQTHLQVNVKGNKVKPRKKKKAKYEECLEMYASLPSHSQVEAVSCIWRSQSAKHHHDDDSEHNDEFDSCETPHRVGTIHSDGSHNSFSDCLEWGSHSLAKSNSNKLKLQILKGLGRKVSRRKLHENSSEFQSCSNVALRVTAVADESSWNNALDAWSKDGVSSYETALLTLNKKDNVERFVSCTDLNAEMAQLKPTKFYYPRTTTLNVDSDETNEQFQDARNFVSK